MKGGRPYSFYELINDHALPHDFRNVFEELNDLRQGTGHIEEMRCQIRGLRNAIRRLLGSLKHSKHNDVTRKILQEYVDRAQKVLRWMMDALGQ